MTRILTGMQASGTPHLGNYLGMMQRTIDLQNDPKNDCWYFIADLHAFTSHPNPDTFRQSQTDCVLDWLALGLDPAQSVFFRQSDVPAHTEAFWLLLTHTPLGLLERAHSYKDKVAKGIEPNAGLLTYPVLMAVDILLYAANAVPVGKDQAQHLEMTRDLAQRWNHKYGDVFTLPQSLIDDRVAVVPGTDGQKMSKSYGNTIPIFGTEKQLKKAVMSIVTTSADLGDPLDPETCNVMALHRLMGNPDVPQLEADYHAGAIGFGHSKKALLAFIWEYFAEARDRRTALESTPEMVEDILRDGAKRAQEQAQKQLSIMRDNLGLSARALI